MTSFAIGGQGSGDFRETSARVHLLHVVTRNSVGSLAPDAFMQTNPDVAVVAPISPSDRSEERRVG